MTSSIALIFPINTIFCIWHCYFDSDLPHSCCRLFDWFSDPFSVFKLAKTELNEIGQKWRRNFTRVCLTYRCCPNSVSKVIVSNLGQNLFSCCKVIKGLFEANYKQQWTCYHVLGTIADSYKSWGHQIRAYYIVTHSLGSFQGLPPSVSHWLPVYCLLVEQLIYLSFCPTGRICS